MLSRCRVKGKKNPPMPLSCYLFSCPRQDAPVAWITFNSHLLKINYMQKIVRIFFHTNEKRYVSYFTGVLGRNKDIQKMGRKYQVHGTVNSRKGYSILKVILGSFTWHNGYHNQNSFRLPGGGSRQKMVGEGSAWYFAIEVTNYLYCVGLWDEKSRGLWLLWSSLTEASITKQNFLYSRTVSKHR